MFAPVASGGGAPQFTGTLGTNVAVTSGTSRGIFKNNMQLNVAFADNHVVPMTINDFKDESSLKGKKRWQPEYTDESQ